MTMDCMRVKVRDGCRGGQEQFTWRSIKDQEFKDRECYLGQSTKVGMMGKFGRYYLHDWYARKRDTAESISDELHTVQAYEEELMQEALGLKPKKLILAKHQMSEEEMKQFLRRDKPLDEQGREAMGPQKKIVTNEFGEQISTSNEDYIGEAVRDAPIKGLGFANHRTAKLERIKAETLGTVGELQGSSALGSSSLVKVEKTEVKDEPADGGGAIVPVATGEARPEEVKREIKREAGSPPAKRRRQEGDGGSDDEARRQRKLHKKEEKKRRKAEKKLKKKEKKEKKKALKKVKKAEMELSRAAARRRGRASRSGSSDSSSCSSS